MEEKILLRIGSRRLHLVKLIGAFIVLGSALMLLSDVYNMVSIISVVTGPAGQSVTLNFYGLVLTQEVADLDMGFKAGLVLVPLAGVMFWSAVLAFGAVLYRTGGFTLPVTEKLKKIGKSSEEAEEEEEVEEEKEEESEEGEEEIEEDEEDEEDVSQEKSRERYKEARGRYVCDVCGEEFDSKRGLHIHQGKSHSD